MLLKSPHFMLQKPLKRSRLIDGLLVSPQNNLIDPKTLNLNGALESMDDSTGWDEESIFDVLGIYLDVIFTSYLQDLLRLIEVCHLDTNPK